MLDTYYPQISNDPSVFITEADIIKSFISAIQTGVQSKIGSTNYNNIHSNADDDENLIFDVWVIRGGNPIVHPNDNTPKVSCSCFAGLCLNNHSFARLYDYYNSTTVNTSECT